MTDNFKLNPSYFEPHRGPTPATRTLVAVQTIYASIQRLTTAPNNPRFCVTRRVGEQSLPTPEAQKTTRTHPDPDIYISPTMGKHGRDPSWTP